MKTPVSRSSTLTPLNHKDPKKLSITPPPSSLKLKMFKLKDPLSKTRIKKQEFAQTEPIIQTQQTTTNLTNSILLLPSIHHKTKREKLRQMQDIESCIEALKGQIWNCQQFRESDTKNIRKEKSKITPTKQSFTFFNRHKIQRQLSHDYLIKKGKIDLNQPPQPQISSQINPENIEDVIISNKLTLDRKLEVRTILSNKIRGNLIQSIKGGDASEVVPKLVNQQKSKWVEKFPEVREAIVGGNLVKKRKYLKSVQSREYNSYYSFLAMPKWGRRGVVQNFQGREKGDS